MRAQLSPPPTSSCPVCNGKNVVRIEPNSLNLAVPTHQCNTCGAKLKSVLKWSTSALTVGVGLLYMLIGLAAYEASNHLPALPPVARFIILLSFLGAVLGYSANRILRSIEYKLWQPRL